MIIVLTLLLTASTVLLGASIGWDQKDSMYHKNSIDKIIDSGRLSIKNNGLVLHMPSYENGIEAYCYPEEQYIKIPRQWIGRI